MTTKVDFDVALEEWQERELRDEIRFQELNLALGKPVDFDKLVAVATAALAAYRDQVELTECYVRVVAEPRQELQDEIKELESEVSDLKTEVYNLTEEVTDLRRDATAVVAAELEAARNETVQWRERAETLRLQLAESEAAKPKRKPRKTAAK